jgi:hypothetical protein
MPSIYAQALLALIVAAVAFPAETHEAAARLVLAVETEWANLQLYIFARITYHKMQRTFGHLEGFPIPPFKFTRIQDRKPR